MAQDQAGIITIAQAAQLLMVTPERVRQLIRSGHIASAGRGHVPLVSAVQGYIHFWESDERGAQRRAALSRVQEARAQEIELRVARQREELAPIDDAIDAMDFVVEITSEELRKLPGRFGGSPETREALSIKVEEAITAIEAKNAQCSASLRRGDMLLG